mmetsp:Transcript_46845/g.123457  ORF Transcript_46845/g.123457 Transcript_46845/m.123457 type:complete len:114 (-) Transcript_46845:1-342(-)
MFVATPFWHEHLPEASRNYDPWSVPYWLHTHFRAAYGDSSGDASAPRTIVYLGVYVHKGVLTDATNERNTRWLESGGKDEAGHVSLALLDGSTLDLEQPLREGRVFITAFGPD